jgi:mono/diheme cytochrome c family protein
MRLSPAWARGLRVALMVVVALAVLVGFVGWYKLFRVVPQPDFANEDMHFKYGSLGAEGDRGVPYLIWLVLPRVFPDLLPGPTGYASLGLAWEPGQELPIGFAKKTMGFPRITNNCAACHASRYRAAEDAPPVFVTAGPAHTSDIQKNIRFLTACARDPRFTADILLDEISRVYGLSALDKMLYRYLIIPFTKRALIRQEQQFAWMDRPGKPHWGAGRDDPMNLTKYFMTSMPEDATVGQADFPSIWNLKVRKGKDLLLNWSGDTPAVRSVIIDSALGLGAPPGEPFLKRMAEIDEFLSELPPPAFPKEFKLDQALVARGATVYEAYCAECHEVGRKWTNKVIPIDEIGTDRERMLTWSQAAADEANQAVKERGIHRPEMVKNFGYVSPPLDGIWLRAPYLHHGSVPNMRALLEPTARRPRWFFRGWDVYDDRNLGFMADHCPQLVRLDPAGQPLDAVKGYCQADDLSCLPLPPCERYDSQERGNGNGGHEGRAYGTELSAPDKDALIEYLKTK